MTTTFKAGDKVYCPVIGNRVYALVSHSDPKNVRLKLQEERRAGGYLEHEYMCFSSCGRSYLSGVVCLHKANKENYERLSQMYPEMEFETPKHTLKGSELAEYLLSKGRVFFAHASDCDENSAIEDGDIFIFSELRNGENSKFFSKQFGCYKYAVPVEIIDNKVVPMELEIDTDTEDTIKVDAKKLSDGDIFCHKAHDKPFAEIRPLKEKNYE